MFETLIDVILPVFLVIAAGYGLTRMGYFNTSQIDGLMRFTTHFAIPCLLFSAIARLDLSIGFDPWLMLSYYASAAICFVLGLFGARFLFHRDWEDSVVIGFCCLFSNSLMLGLPISERAYGADNLAGNYAIIAVHAPFCYGLGITVMEFVRNRNKSGWQVARSVLSGIFKNALIVGVLAGFLVNLTGIAMPSVVDDALDLISRATLPGALFALGGVLLRYRPEGDLRTIVFICTMSLLVHPALVWVFGTSASLSENLFRSALLTSAMAPGFNSYMFASMYGRAQKVVASSVLIATASSLITVWMWLNILA